MAARRVAMATVLTVTVMLSWSASSAAASVELRPDLKPLQASDLAVERVGDTRNLRFSTTSWNEGAGPLELVGGAKEKKSGRQKVHQRLYSDGGTYRDVLAGSFTYHRAHAHIHFDDYAVYTLRSVTAPGQSDRISAKTTFCVMDTHHVSPRLPGSPASARYTVCESQIQGMSVGWGDEYRSHLDGQAIDITGLPDGDYDLLITVDPKGRIIESDESDNTSSVRLRLANGTVTRLA